MSCQHIQSRQQSLLVFELAEQHRLAAGLSPDHCFPQFDRAAKPKLSAAFLLVFPHLSCANSHAVQMVFHAAEEIWARLSSVWER